MLRPSLHKISKKKVVTEMDIINLKNAINSDKRKMSSDLVQTHQVLNLKSLETGLTVGSQTQRYTKADLFLSKPNNSDQSSNLEMLGIQTGRKMTPSDINFKKKRSPIRVKQSTGIQRNRNVNVIRARYNIHTSP